MAKLDLTTTVILAPESCFKAKAAILGWILQTPVYHLLDVPLLEVLPLDALLLDTLLLIAILLDVLLHEVRLLDVHMPD
jgi:hypothetical protein